MPTRSQWIVNKSEVVSRDGVVTTMYPHATEAGAEILAAGGNAVDAAVAAAFAIGVVEPFNSGLGGIAIFVHYDNATGKTHVIDATSRLPRKIRPEMFVANPTEGRTGVYGWPAVKDDANNTGWLAPAVPGTPACLDTALTRFGTLPRQQVMAPAIRLAEGGYELDWYVTLGMAAHQHRLQRFPESRRTFYRPDGACYHATMLGSQADWFVQPDLARSLRLIAEQGSDVVYRGEIAKRIADDMRANGGLIDEDDLAAYAVRVFEGGLVGEYRGFQVVGAPEISGSPTVVQALNLLEGFDVAALPHGSVEMVHLMAEVERLAFLDRLQYLGDTSLMAVPSEGITSKAYANVRRQDFDPRRAGVGVGAGDPWPFDSTHPTTLAAAAAGGGEGATTHLTVIDRDHNMVSLTSTLGGLFGSGVVIKDTGITLNNATMWFNPQPGAVNSIGPGKRILSAATPTLVLRDGKPVAALGSPGGRKVVTAILQCVVNLIDYQMGPQSAVSAPRVHCEGAETLLDARFGEETAAGLQALGHDLDVRAESFSSTYFARPNGITIDPETGVLRGGVNQFKPAMGIGL